MLPDDRPSARPMAFCDGGFALLIAYFHCLLLTAYVQCLPFEIHLY